MAPDRRTEPDLHELRGVDRLFAMQALTNERLATMAEALDGLRAAVDGGNAALEARVHDLELEQATQRGVTSALTETVAVLAQGLTKAQTEQAEQRGALKILRWAVPGGPALVALIGAAGLYFAR